MKFAQQGTDMHTKTIDSRETILNEKNKQIHTRQTYKETGEIIQVISKGQFKQTHKAHMHRDKEYKADMQGNS